MIALALALLAQTAAPPPSAEAIALGREIAESGMLAGLLPIVARRDIDELIADNPSLTAAEQTRLRAIGDRLFAEGRDRLMASNGRAYAERLTLEQMRAIAAFNRSPAAAALREATPGALVATMQAIGDVDLKQDIRTAFCRETGRLCPPAR